MIKNLTTEHHLDEAGVKEIVARYFQSKCHNVTCDDIELRTGRRTEGYGPMEHDVICFDECIVTTKGELYDKKRKSA